jgi:hypothetical protein
MRPIRQMRGPRTVDASLCEKQRFNARYEDEKGPCEAPAFGQPPSAVAAPIWWVGDRGAVGHSDHGQTVHEPRIVF